MKLEQEQKHKTIPHIYYMAERSEDWQIRKT